MRLKNLIKYIRFGLKEIATRFKFWFSRVIFNNNIKLYMKNTLAKNENGQRKHKTIRNKAVRFTKNNNIRNTINAWQ